MDASLVNRVRERARHRCEYCHLPAEFSSIPFEIDHIVAEQHGGVTAPGNLALCFLQITITKVPTLAASIPRRDAKPGYSIRADTLGIGTFVGTGRYSSGERQ
jgi:hypothetical protein